MSRVQRISGIVLVAVGGLVLLASALAYLTAYFFPVLVATMFGFFPIGLGATLILTDRANRGDADFRGGLRMIQFWMIAQCLYASLMLLLITVGGLMGMSEGRLEAAYFADAIIVVMLMALFASAGSLWIIKRRNPKTPLMIVGLYSTYYLVSVVFAVRSLVLGHADSPVKIGAQLAVGTLIFAAGLLYLLRSTRARAYYGRGTQAVPR